MYISNTLLKNKGLIERGNISRSCRHNERRPGLFLSLVWGSELDCQKQNSFRLCYTWGKRLPYAYAQPLINPLHMIANCLCSHSIVLVVYKGIRNFFTVYWIWNGKEGSKIFFFYPLFIRLRQYLANLAPFRIQYVSSLAIQTEVYCAKAVSLKGQ